MSCRFIFDHNHPRWLKCVDCGFTLRTIGIAVLLDVVTSMTVINKEEALEFISNDIRAWFTRIKNRRMYEDG